MKSYSNLTLLFLFLFCQIIGSQNASAQSYPAIYGFECGNSDIPSDGERDEELSEECVNVNFSAAIPQLISYIPSISDPVLTVRINLIFLSEDDGSGMFSPNNPEHVFVWDVIENDINIRYANLLEPNYLEDPECLDNNAPFLSNSKLQFEFNRVYIQNSDLFNSYLGCSSYSIRTTFQPFLDLNYPELRCSNSINFITPTDPANLDTVLSGGDWTGCNLPNATLPSFSNLNAVEYFHIPNLYSKFVWMKNTIANDTLLWEDVVRGWFTGSTSRSMTHEIGHTLGLHHSNGIHGINQCDYSIMHQGGSSPGKYLPVTEIGRMHRALAHSSARSKTTLSSYSSGPITISGHDVWDTDRKFYRPIRIANGGKLTIKCRALLHPDASIIVEPGGTLIVDGGILTSYCDELWQGIEVWGSGNENQYASGGQYQQGRAIFRNGALIENAWEGVRNHKPGQWGTSGGIIQAKNSTFKNCRRMVEFISYQNFSGTTNMPDRSYFSQCDFIKDDDFVRDPNVSPPHPMITMWDVDRVRFSGCNFINDATLGNTSELQSNAILSIDASYYIQAHCSSVNPNGCPTNNLTKSRFKGWYKGIEALGSNSARGILVRNTIFDENMIGIEINGADYSQIYKNEFNVGNHNHLYSSEPEVVDLNHLGIYSNKTLHFAIEENFFESPLQGAPYGGHGVLVYNSLGADNQIYNNFFENLETGANGWQINLNENSNGGVPFGQSGLQFLCNTNTSNEVDFEISRSGDPFTPGYTNSGIRMRQGNFNPAKSAGNTFSVPNPDPNVFSHWTVNSLHPYNYYTTTSISPEEAEIGPEEMDIEIVSAFNGCLPNYTIGAGIVKTDLLIKLTEFNGLKYTYLQTIDDGNTPGEINEIELAWPQDAWDLRDELISRSPNNSEDVLIALIRKDIMPNAMLLEVLLANPDALRSGSVIRVASTEVHPPLPQYMIDMLYASRNGTTLRTSMESALADLHMEVQRLQKRIVGQIMFADSLHSQSDSTLYYLQKVRTVEGNYSRAAALAERHMYTQANMVLDSMLVSYKLNTTRSAEVSALKDFYAFLNSAHSAGKDLANLDSSEVQSLRGIAESTTAGLAAQKAQNALCFFYAICYDAQGQPKSMGTAKKPKPTLEELVAELNQVNAYPSPSDQHVTITYSLLNARENTTLQVFDFLGREVVNHKIGRVYQGQHLIDTRKYANGLYLYQIVQDDIKTSEGKFIVTH